MATPDDLVIFLIKAAATVVQLNRALGPDDEPFRQLAIGNMVEDIPLLTPWNDLHERLHTGGDPINAVSHAFSEQAVAYSEAAARATVAVVEEAVAHLHAAGGEETVTAFLDRLQRQNGEPEA